MRGVTASTLVVPHAHFKKKVSQVERNRPVLPPVMLEHRVTKPVTQERLNCDGPLADGWPNVCGRLLRQGVGMKNLGEARAILKELSYERRTPLLVKDAA